MYSKLDSRLCLQQYFGLEAGLILNNTPSPIPPLASSYRVVCWLQLFRVTYYQGMQGLTPPCILRTTLPTQGMLSSCLDSFCIFDLSEAAADCAAQVFSCICLAKQLNQRFETACMACVGGVWNPFPLGK